MTAPTRTTLVDIRPLREPAAPAREHLLGLARRGRENGGGLDARSVRLVCGALLHAVSALDAARSARAAAETRVIEAEGQLAAARAANAGLLRQLAAQIDGLVFTAVFVDPTCAPPPSDFGEQTRRRVPAIVRRDRNQHTATTRSLDALRAEEGTQP